MSEIEKMYKLANVQLQYKKRIECKDGYSVGQPCGKSPCIDCDKSVFEDVMPPFTAEKQLNLMAFLINRKVELSFKAEQGEITVEAISRGLAGLINKLWQELTEKEKQQVKGILE